MQKKRTVLLVDDEEMIIQVAQRMLERMGCSVLTARSGKEAVDLFHANHDRIACVILDMVLPDLNGLQIYDQLKAVNPSVKVLITTGYDMTSDVSEALHRGCSGYMQKPFTVEQFSVKIRSILGR